MEIRNATPDDYSPIIGVLNDWWGGRQMSYMLPKLFFVHFHDTSFVVIENDQIAGFLIGFLSQTFPNEAYIHFVGVHPDFRKRGVGKMLYERFFEVVRQHNRHIVRCVTSPVNRTSIAFHTQMGFMAEPGTLVSESGVPASPNYDGAGEHRVRFVKEI